MEIHQSIPMTDRPVGHGRETLPIESFLKTSSHSRCNHLKHLGVPIVVALMYNSNQTFQIPNISNLETAPYGEICDQDVDQPFEYSRSQTMQHIPDDVYDTLLNNVLYARINENSKNDIADDSEDPDPIPKKRSRKKR
jgi:hypothetical protein